MNQMIRLFGLCLWISVLPANAGTDSFNEGLAAMRDGQLKEASAAFRTSIHQSASSGALNNLGIVEWQRGHAGNAILAWEQARWLDPFNRQIADNLQFARTAAQIEPPRLTWYETASTWLPPNWWVWLAGLALWTSIGAVVLPRLLWRPKSGWQGWLAAMGFGCFIFCLTANIGVISRANIGVVIRKEAQLRLTPTRNSELITTLIDGETIRIIKMRGKYSLVKADGGTGWLAEGDFEPINRP